MAFLTSLSVKTTPSSRVSRGQRMKSLLAGSLSATFNSNHLFLDPLSFFSYPDEFCWGFRCDQFKLFNPLLEISLWRLALLRGAALTILRRTTSWTTASSGSRSTSLRPSGHWTTAAGPSSSTLSTCTCVCVYLMASLPRESLELLPPWLSMWQI